MKGEFVTSVQGRTSAAHLINRPGVARAVLQLDGVGPVDKRPYTD